MSEHIRPYEAEHETDYVTAYAEEVLADEGTIVLFAGVDDSGSWLAFAVDPRSAEAIVAHMEEHGVCPVELESWQILRKEA